jgi:tellurite resistance protein TerC
MGWDFLAGYLVEKALSLDNIFVFVVIFGYFGIPAVQQHRILYYGILGAVAMRGALIAAGSALLQYEWALILFGVFLILTGVKMAVLPTKAGGLEDNLLIRWVKAWLPVTPTLHGDRFLVRMGGVWHATPLLLALAVIEMSDLIFAVDSVPAIFGLTHEPLVVFTSNVFAILGLRSLYFLLAEAVQRFQLLKYGLAAILVFVGLKMAWLNGAMGGKFPATWSLGIIATILAGATLASMVTSRRAEAITRVRT